MRKRDRNLKASDLFRESNPLIGPKVSFKEAFPSIQELKIEVTERGKGVKPAGNTYYYDLDNFPGEYIDCSNPMCYGGGFSIGFILHSMVSKGETERETTVSCQGYEGSPKGRRKYGPCFNYFQVKITIKYRSSGLQDPSS